MKKFNSDETLKLVLDSDSGDESMELVLEESVEEFSSDSVESEEEDGSLEVMVGSFADLTEMDSDTDGEVDYVFTDGSDDETVEYNFPPQHYDVECDVEIQTP